jgi:hypothetical protein
LIAGHLTRYQFLISTLSALKAGCQKPEIRIKNQENFEGGKGKCQEKNGRSSFSVRGSAKIYAKN